MPPKERSDKGENKTDGFDFELYSKIELIDKFRGRNDIIEEYKIGKESAARFGALDDLVAKVKLKGCNEELTYALQAKQTMKDDQSQTDKLISCQNLWKECGRKNYYVPKYFRSYLKIKKHTLPSQLKEMIIWTTQGIADTTYFVPYVPDPAGDVMENVGDNSVQRWKLDWTKMNHPEYGDLKQLLLDEVHPLKEVVDKFIQVLFKKEEWHSKKGAKTCYRAMANEVIDCDGKVFLDGFVRADASLLPDTLIFRRIFERAMKVKIGDNFSMDQLNSDDYKKYFILKIDDDFTEGSGPYSWNVKEYVAIEQDLKDFVDRFVFYVNVPKVENFGKTLKRKFGENKFKELCSLVKACTLDKMAPKEEIDAIFDLLALRSKTDLKSDPILRFEEDDYTNLRQKLENSKHILIEANQDIDCSVNRVFLTEEFERTMVPCLAFRYRNFVRHREAIIAVTKQATVCNHGLRSILVSDVEQSSIEDLLKDLVSFTGKIILLSSEQVENPGNLDHFKDEFDVDKLTEECKNFINSKEIDVFGNIVSVEELLPVSFIRKDNHKLVLKLYRHPASESFKLGRNNLRLDPLFDSRLKELDPCVGCPIVLSDHAGMGKTTELFHIADTVRKQQLDCLALYMDCKAAVTVFHNDPSLDGVEKLINTVYEMIHAVEYQKLMVQELFQSKAVFLFLDGYDEVSQERQADLEEMIAACASADLRGLCIATRPHCLERIKEKLGQTNVVKVYKLNPFSEEEQLDYLMRAWNTANMDAEECTRVVENATNLIRRFQAVFKQEALLGIPLQMKMISTVYAEEIKSESFEPPKNFQMGSILEQFAIRRMNLMIDKSKPEGKAQEEAFEQLRKAFPDDHVKMALNVYRGTEKAVARLFEQYETYGLVRLNPSEEFCHETYLSYFLAMYFAIYPTEPNEFKQYMKRYLCPNRVDIATKFIDFHLGNLIQDAENDDERSKSLEAKTNEFRQYLENSCTETERFTLLRSSLNATALNVFDVLYSSFNQTDRETLQFRFGGSNNQTENRHLINLKRLGGDQMLQLLCILASKHRSKFVTEILTKFSNDEEDFIEVACRKPFLQVFLWLFDKDSYFNTHERDELLEYLRQRITTYLKVVVQHNNESVLMHIIDWARSNFSKEVVATWLEDHRLLEVFISNVGEKCDNKPLLIDHRLIMVESVSGLCRWVYGENYQLTKSCQDEIKKIVQDEIKAAFEVHFHN